MSIEKTSKDLQTARRTIAEDHFKRLNNSLAPNIQNIKKWGVARAFWTDMDVYIYLWLIPFRLVKYMLENNQPERHL